MNKIKIFMLFLITVTIVGCGTLDPDKVTENYVKKEFREQLDRMFSKYGIKYQLEITSFDKNSEGRAASGIVKLKDSFNTVCEITGAIGKDNFDGQTIGTSYHVDNTCRIEILSNAERELNNKYSFLINNDTDYEVLASNIKSYIKDLKNLLNEYKDGVFKYYFDDKYSYAEIDITINNEDIEKKNYLDNTNELVIIDFSQGDYGWHGELELSEYLKLLANGELQEKIDEIRINHYGHK